MAKTLGLTYSMVAHLRAGLRAIGLIEPLRKLRRKKEIDELVKCIKRNRPTASDSYARRLAYWASIGLKEGRLNTISDESLSLNKMAEELELSPLTIQQARIGLKALGYSLKR